MKFAIVIAAMVSLASLMMAKKHKRSHRNKVCENGTKTFNSPCTWKVCGSECAKGFECGTDNFGKSVCKIHFLSKCSKHSDCVADSTCRKDVGDKDKTCHKNPLGTTQKEMKVADDLGFKTNRRFK